MNRFCHVVVLACLCGPAAVAQTTAPPTAPQSATPPTQPAPPQPAAAPSTTPAAQEILYEGEATSILGRSVQGSDAHEIGLVVDVLVDDTGQPRAAVVDFGGFLGIGNRRVAIVWRALRFTVGAKSGTISVDLTADQLRTTPEYKATTKPVMMAVPPTAPAPPGPTPLPPAKP
jgi:hypothetical protein